MDVETSQKLTHSIHIRSFSSLLFLAPRYLSSDDVIKPKIECIDLLPTVRTDDTLFTTILDINQKTIHS